MTDYPAIAEQWCLDIVSGAIPACKWTILAAQRNLTDLRPIRGHGGLPVGCVHWGRLVPSACAGLLAIPVPDWTTEVWQCHQRRPVLVGAGAVRAQSHARRRETPLLGRDPVLDAHADRRTVRMARF